MKGHRNPSAFTTRGLCRALARGKMRANCETAVPDAVLNSLSTRAPARANLHRT